MKDIILKINEAKESKSYENAMKEWNSNLQSPFGLALKEFVHLIYEHGYSDTKKNDYYFTPFDNYIIAYALDGDKKYAFKNIKAICDEHSWSQIAGVKKMLQNLKNYLNIIYERY